MPMTPCAVCASNSGVPSGSAAHASKSATPPSAPNSTLARFLRCGSSASDVSTRTSSLFVWLIGTTSGLVVDDARISLSSLLVRSAGDNSLQTLPDVSGRCGALGRAAMDRQPFARRLARFARSVSRLVDFRRHLPRLLAELPASAPQRGRGGSHQSRAQLLQTRRRRHSRHAEGNVAPAAAPAQRIVPDETGRQVRFSRTRIPSGGISSHSGPDAHAIERNALRRLFDRVSPRAGVTASPDSRKAPAASKVPPCALQQRVESTLLTAKIRAAQLRQCVRRATTHVWARQKREQSAIPRTELTAST